MKKPIVHFNHRASSAKRPYHYTECGLDHIYLVSGYEMIKSNYGQAVAIHQADALHRAIGQFLVRKKKVLSGKELRFLRTEMDLTQAELGKLLGLTDQAVARWEKEQTDIASPADYLIRLLFLDHIGLPKGLAIRNFLVAVERQQARAKNEKQLFERSSHSWRLAA
ncbi:MAG: helix-turn-helix domain-containing protein [Rudaea sp.]